MSSRGGGNTRKEEVKEFFEESRGLSGRLLLRGGTIEMGFL